MEKPDGRCRVFTPWKHVRCFALIAMCSVLGAGSTHAAQIMIDDFSEPNPAQFFVLGVGNNPTKAMTDLTGGAIGGQRDTLISVFGQAQPNSAVGLLGYDSNFGMNAFQLGTNGDSPTVATLQYNGPDIAATAAGQASPLVIGNGLGVDLTDGGTNNRFEFKFSGSDAQPSSGLDVVITLTSVGGGTSSVTGIAGNSQSAFTLVIPFSGLVGNANLQQVEGLTIAFNSLGLTPNIDFEVTQIVAVPEPATLTLAGLAGGVWVLAMGMKRRNRRAMLHSAA